MKRDEDYLKLVDGVKVLNFGSGHAWGMIGLSKVATSDRTVRVISRI